MPEEITKDNAQEPASESVEEEKRFSKAEENLIDEACKAYGVSKRFLFASNVRPDPETGRPMAWIVTNGGSKVAYSKGDKVDELSQIEITGINPEWGKRKPVAGKKKA